MAKQAKLAQAARRPGTDVARRAARAFPKVQTFEDANPKVKAAIDAMAAPRGKTRAEILDRSRDYSEIHPPGSHHGAHFEQNGKHFDQQGVRMKDFPGEKEAAEAAQKAAQRRGRARADDSDAAEPGDPLLEQGTDDADIELVLDDDVNLTAWGEGLLDLRFSQVRDAIRKRYGKVVSTEVQALEFLAGEGVITEHKVRGGR